MVTRTKLIGGAVAAAIVGYLAFGVFGVHTAFIDDEVNEAPPSFDTAAASGLASDDLSPSVARQMGEAMADENKQAVEESNEPMPDMVDEPEVIEAFKGSFIDRTHPGNGTVVVLADAAETQRFLRFEEDFATDNGPDLNVYLVAGANADSDKGLFDDDFVDLGDLKGNRGAQNYEIPEGLDLDRYNTVVVWCVRFGVAFTTADLA